MFPDSDFFWLAQSILGILAWSRSSRTQFPWTTRSSCCQSSRARSSSRTRFSWTGLLEFGLDKTVFKDSVFMDPFVWTRSPLTRSVLADSVFMNSVFPDVSFELFEAKLFWNLRDVIEIREVSSNFVNRKAFVLMRFQMRKYNDEKKYKMFFFNSN